MSFKLRALGIGLLVSLAVGAVAVINAAATTGGHFVSDVEHTIIKGSSNATHFGVLSFHGSEGELVCDESSSEATATSSTVTQLDGSPKLAKCHTKGSANAVTVDLNGCVERVTIAPGNPETTEQTTADYACPPGAAIVITHPNCTVTIPQQTGVGSGTYTRITDNGKYAITTQGSSEFTAEFHGGICIFLGTTHKGTSTGSAIVRGYNTLGEQVNITST